MEKIKELANFYSAIQHDSRIGPIHISLYMALFYFYNLNGFQNPIKITRNAVMKVAKINGLATYHKCIRGLAEFGYIQYEPSFNSAVGSQVRFIVGIKV